MLWVLFVFIFLRFGHLVVLASFIKWSRVKSLSHVWLFATPWTIAYQAPQSMEFSRQEYWSGLPFPSPGDLPDSGIEPGSPTLQADALPSEPPGKPISFIKNTSCFPIALLLSFFLRKKTYWLGMCSSVPALWFSSTESSFCHSYSLMITVDITTYTKSSGQVV